MTFVVNVVDKLRIKSALVSIDDEHGNGTTAATRKHIDAVEVEQYFDKNFASDSSAFGCEHKVIDLPSKIGSRSPAAHWKISTQ